MQRFPSSAEQPGDRSADSSAVQPAHRSAMKRVNALNLEGFMPKIQDTEPTTIGWIELPPRQTDQLIVAAHGDNQNRTKLAREFKQSLELVQRRLASSQLSLAQRREHHWDSLGSREQDYRWDIPSGERITHI